MTLPRGFSAQAERLAHQCRTDAGCAETVPVDVKAVAAAANVAVVAADTLIPVERLHDLERLQAYAFSACTFDVDGRSIIVYSPIHTAGRSSSDIAHELGHILLNHDLSEIQEVSGLPFRTCLPDQEEQATALGAAILVPEKALMTAAYAGATVEHVAREFEVTVPMARYRWNKLGVSRRLDRRSARSS